MRKGLAGILLTISIASWGQTRWQKYDSIYNENLFRPNFSNLLMPKGYVEVIVNNSLLTANHGFSSNTGARYDLNARYTYDYTTVIVNAGVSQSNRFNIGLEAHYNKGYRDSDPGSSPFNIFVGAPPGYVARASALTSIGPRIKWRPFEHNLRFVYTGTYQIPLSSNAATEAVLGRTQPYWGNQFLYSFSVGKKLIFFADDDIFIYFKEGTNSYTSYFHGLSGYGYLLLTRHFFPFVTIGYIGSYGGAGGGLREQANAVPLGAGLQYQASLRFNFNVYYNAYAAAKGNLDLKTVNVGLRAVF